MEFKKESLYKSLGPSIRKEDEEECINFQVKGSQLSNGIHEKQLDHGMR